MDFNNHDLYDFTSKLKTYSKRKKISQHKATTLFAKEKKEKILNGYTVKVLTKEPMIEKVKETESKSFFNNMMIRHKRRSITK